MHYSGHYKTPTSSLIAKESSQLYNPIHHHSQPPKIHGFFCNAHFARKRNHQLPKQTYSSSTKVLVLPLPGNY